MQNDGILSSRALVILAGFTAFMCLAGGCLAGFRSSNDKTEITGTIILISPESGAYAISGDDGIFYYPVNPDAASAKNNTRVMFTFIPTDEPGSAGQWGKTVKITSIHTISAPSLQVDPRTVTIEESRLCAERYVIAMKEYSAYGGSNLTLSEVVTLRCPSCWQFVYTFDMKSLKDPALIDRAAVGVTVESGKITDVVASYGLKNT